MSEQTETTIEPPPPAVPPLQAAGRGVKVALAVSVALNLAVAGLVAGLAFHGGPGGRGEMMVRDMGFGPFDEALLPEDRDALRKVIRDRFGDIRAARQAMQTDVEAIILALKADPFVPAGLSAALAAQAEHLGERLEFGSGVIGDYLLAMPDAARSTFADRLEERLRRGPGGGRDKGDGHDEAGG